MVIEEEHEIDRLLDDGCPHSDPVEDDYPCPICGDWAGLFDDVLTSGHHRHCPAVNRNRRGEDGRL